MLTLTFQRPGGPPYEVTVPTAAVEAADKYAQSIGLAGSEHLMMRVLLDQLLVRNVIPNAELPSEVAAELAAIDQQAAALKAQRHEKELATFLPVLKIGGQVVTLPQIEAQLAAERAAKAAADRKAAQDAQFAADNP